MMEFFKKIFHRHRKEFKPQPKQLRIDGVKTVMTPSPDDAELAAQALLESRLSPDPSLGARGANSKSAKKTRAKGNHPLQSQGGEGGGPPHDVAYYKALSEKIKASKAAERRLTMRYLAYCEEQLALPQPLYVGQIGEMEQELYRRQDVAEREGGELLRRWQHCLAECIVRQMNAPIEQEESDARIDSPEREEGQTKFNSTTDSTDSTDSETENNTTTDLTDDADALNNRTEGTAGNRTEGTVHNRTEGTV